MRTGPARSVTITASSAPCWMLCCVSVPYFGSRWLREDTIGVRDRIIVPNCRRRLTSRPVSIAIARVHVEIRAVDPVMLGEQRAEHRRRIDAAGTLPVTVDFLQRDDVGVPYFGRDAREVVAAVLAEPVLDVVRDELHALTHAMFIDLASCQRQIHELLSRARVGQLQHAAVGRQNQLLFRQVAEGFVGALYQGFHSFRLRSHRHQRPPA